MVVWLGGCGTLSATKEAATFRPLADASLEDLLGILNERYREIDALKALVRVEAEVPGQRSRFNGILSYNKPDAVRFRALDPLGRVMMDVEVREDGITLDPAQPVRPRAGEDFIRRVEERGLTGRAELIAMMSVPGGLAQADGMTAALEKGHDTYILYFLKVNGSTARLAKKVWLERVHFRIIRLEAYDPDGRRWMDVSLDEYQKVDGHWWPMQVRAKMGERHSIHLGYRELQLNPDEAPGVSRRRGVDPRVDPSLVEEEPT